MNYKDKSGINFNAALEAEAMDPNTDMKDGFKEAILDNKAQPAPATYAAGKAPMLKRCGSSRYKKK